MSRRIVLAICVALTILSTFGVAKFLDKSEKSTDPEYLYKLITSCENCNNANVFAILSYEGNGNNYINQSNLIIQKANFSYCFINENQLQIKIVDNTKQRWEVPHEAPFPHNDPKASCIDPSQANAKVTYTDNPFSFKVTRTSNGDVLFDTANSDLIFSEYYLQISTKLPTQNLYGFGERNYKLDLGEGGTFTLFNKDQPVNMEDGTPGHNLYGYHPVYLQREQSGGFSMVLLRSSNAMDVVIEKDGVLTYKVIGGVFDFNIFLGDGIGSKSPEKVIQSYHQFLGNWIMHPFWSFGHHQSRWGYANVGQLQAVLKGYQDNSLPLDVIWSDINYMKDLVDFIIDEENFPAEQMNSMLQKYKKRWVPIVDAGIALNNNPYFNKSIDEDIYIKDPNGQYLLGSVWPGDVHYPDFFQPNTSGYWSFGLELIHSKVPMSGIWLDMNEASNFVNGEENWSPKSDDLLNLPPYVPATPGHTIYEKAMRMDAVHYNNFTEYNAHNFFGFLESKATHEYLLTKSKLSFILSRSTFYGSGQFTTHWTGDNGATWDFLKVAGPTLMNFGIFGIPMVGPDMCGFALNTTEELCSRWYQAGTLYPFSRNHNEMGAISQEPFAMGPTLLKTARLALRLRYSLLKHMYSLFLSLNGKGTVFRPLFFEFPEDKTFYDHSNSFENDEYLIGSSIVVAPVLSKGSTSVQVYLPQATWFDYATGEVVQEKKNSNPSPFTVQNELNTTVQMYVRGGYVIGRQNTTFTSRTDDLDGHYDLLVALQETKLNVYYAKGGLLGISNMEDSNVVDKCIDKNCVYSVTAGFYILTGQYKLALNFALQNKDVSDEKIYLDSATIYGAWDSEVSKQMKIDLAKITWSAVDENGQSIEASISFESDSKIVVIPSKPQLLYPGKILTFKGPAPLEMEVE